MRFVPHGALESLSFCWEISPAFPPLQAFDLKAVHIDSTKACYNPSTLSDSVFSCFLCHNNYLDKFRHF